MATSRDVREVISKLSSDKAKVRDEGSKLLFTWLDGDRSLGFCRLLTRNTLSLSSDQETWPFLIRNLIECVKFEVASSKRRPPKITFAKLLRTAVQRAEDVRSSGKRVLLMPVVKQLFTHILDVATNVVVYLSEYSLLLRHLLSNKEYRYQMKKRAYCGLVLLYIEKIWTAVVEGGQNLPNIKEDVFRNVLTLHVLLENPPGDLPPTLKEDVVKGFADIFSKIREGKISRKLIECINTYLLKDGPNLGCLALDIHSSLQDLFIRCWFTRDRGLKNSLILYAKLQLKLIKDSEGSFLVEQLLDVIDKELDQGNIAVSGNLKDHEDGTLGSSQQGLMELAAMVYYQACERKTRASNEIKRLRREKPSNSLKERLMNGKCLWCGSFYFLIHNYGSRIDPCRLMDWFQAISHSFARILAHANLTHSYDGVIWLLRSLEDLSSIFYQINLNSFINNSFPSDKIRGGWCIIWNSLMHALPIFSNHALVADAAFTFLGNMIANVKDTVHLPVVPQDIWELQIFKNMPSASILHFIACYFSRRGVQGEPGDVFLVRRNLLRGAMGLINFEKSFFLDVQIAVLLPAAMSSLCSGCCPFSFIDISIKEAGEQCNKVEETYRNPASEFSDCSVEVLAKLEHGESRKVVQSDMVNSVRLPRETQRLLIFEIEKYLLQNINVHKGIEKFDLPDIIVLCSFSCNVMYASSAWFDKEKCFLPLREQILELLDQAVFIIEGRRNELKKNENLGAGSISSATNSIFISFRSLMLSPILANHRETIDMKIYHPLVKALEKVLLAFVALFKDYSNYAHRMDFMTPHQLHLSDIPSQSSNSGNDNNLRIVDLELDVDDGSNDAETFVSTETSFLPSSFSYTQWKVDMISIIALFSSVLPTLTRECLFGIMGQENDPKVLESVICWLCKSYSSHAVHLMELVKSIENMVEKSLVSFTDILTPVKYLLEKFVMVPGERDGNDAHVKDIISEQNLQLLAALVNKISDIDYPDWHSRVILIDCICCFVELDPSVGQAMIPRLLSMLQDADFRVRLFVAREIGVLFRIWDGHDELFQDACSKFGFPLVTASREKVVKAREVVSSTHCGPVIETVLITLAHIAVYSETLEMEVIFMICAIAAVYPSQRELIYALLDNLSRLLLYSSRTKYLEELMGPILWRWVTCEVSLTSLAEIRGIFVVGLDAKHFINRCSAWLLPSLIINQDFDNLNLVSRIVGQPLSNLSKDYFVQIFSLCMALHCSNHPNKEIGELVLHNLLLKIAEISENERDNLIKKHMVSIVSCLLSLASPSLFPTMPFFSRETIAFCLRMVVDGFLEMDTYSSTSAPVVDKLNIFRPDRVFRFLLEIHHQITTALHPRHKCQRLSALGVLVNVVGNRITVPSTSYYIFNLVGQFVGEHDLQDQCCDILSTVIATFSANHTYDISIVLGRQLQFLVSKLVACYLPCRNNKIINTVPSSKVLNLLHQLILEAHPSLHEFVRELEPFPEFDCFIEIRKFHDEIRYPDTPRDHLLKFVDRISHLSPGLISWSLQSLHKKLIIRETRESNKIASSSFLEFNSWDSDPELVSAVWKLAGMCDTEKMQGVSELIADFISRVGIGDPYRVVFCLPGKPVQKQYGQLCGNYVFNDTIVPSQFLISAEQLVILIKLLKTHIQSENVTIIDVAVQALQEILSTERGQAALQLLDSYERSFIDVHVKGVDHNISGSLLKKFEEKCTGASWNDSSLWTTTGKSYKMWICPLVHLFISCCSDIILQLCLDIVLLSDEVAEFLFPICLLNLAELKEPQLDVCNVISEKIQENIFTSTNKLIKPIQVVLDALNNLRSYNVLTKANITPMISKHGRTSSSRKGGYMADKSKENAWAKVYWLSLDYILVAKAAIRCGSFFTAIMYVEYWCEEHFNGLTLGNPDFSNLDRLAPHVDLLIAAVMQINEPDSIYGIIQTHKLTSQIITYEHEENWSKALECYDLLIRTPAMQGSCRSFGSISSSSNNNTHSVATRMEATEAVNFRLHKGVLRSLQHIGCTHVLDVYSQGLVGQNANFLEDSEFTDLQYETAWREGNWDFSFVTSLSSTSPQQQSFKEIHFNENLHSCLRALQEGNPDEFRTKIKDSKKDLILSICHSSHESTRYIHSTIIKIQMVDHLSAAWNLRWVSHDMPKEQVRQTTKGLPDPAFPTVVQMGMLNEDWSLILNQIQLNHNLLEPFLAFRRVLLQILNCYESRIEHLLQSASALRKGGRFSLAVAALQEFKLLCGEIKQGESSHLFSLGKIEEARVLWDQGQQELAINLAKFMIENYQLEGEAPNVYRLVGKWLGQTRSSNSRTILEYLRRSVELTEQNRSSSKKCLSRQCQTYFNLAHYSDALFRSYEERLASSEWQAAIRLRKHKARELDALIRRLKVSRKGEKTDYASKVQELQKQLTMDKEEAQKMQDDSDNFLHLALEGYQQCLVVGSKKYDIRVVFRLVSLWFSLCSRQIVIQNMVSTVKQVQSYKFIPLVYQIASRMGSPKDSHGSVDFQAALILLVKKMAIDHPYHTIYQLLALANGDRIKDKQRNRNSFIVDMDKKVAAENLLTELSSHHGAKLLQMKQMVEVYIKLAELETKKEETNKRMPLPRDIRNLRQLELVPVVTASFPVDPSCQYDKGCFPHFDGLVDSIIVMNGINAPKVVECLGSDGHKYRQLAKSGNDDLRQDAVMEQFFGLVNTFLQSRSDTWKRKLRIRTYKVVPFTPSAGLLEWVDGTIPLGEYLLGRTRNGGAHGLYGIGDWSFLQCREHMSTEKDKRKAFRKVCDNFRPVMHYFFLERFLQPADWFEKRLSYIRSVAASSMVGYIVGLGDRHAMNILIDQVTAEVVHIDLGVAFEQGLMLKTPEQVPFRLTRDMIDAMGVTGVEGVFRRCCEESLSVMRTNKEALLTIIEVFIHDPLYKWALSPLKALQRQKEVDDIDLSLEDSQDAYEGNKDAARALLRVKQKLDGYEDGQVRSIQGQVQQLIQDAIDPERLSQMFPGWGAWL